MTESKDFIENEFLHYMGHGLGPKMPPGCKDIEDVLSRYTLVNQDHHIDPAHFIAHPKVKHFAPARSTKKYIEDKDYYVRYRQTPQQLLKGDWSNCNATVLSERDALLEAARCLKCVNAPCVSSCPSSVDIPAFIQAIENQNWYQAGKIILSANSNGLSCGSICATSDLCSGSCTLATPHSKGINIEGLQAFALQKFAQLNIKPSLDPSKLAPTGVISTKIAVIGAGPAGLAAATFLARYGYTQVTVFEKEQAAGGINTFELPEFRLPHEDVRFEVRLLEQLGVKFVYGQSFVEVVDNDATQISYKSLQSQGYSKFFLAIGRPSPILLDIFKPYTPEQGLYNSKQFLPITTIGSKPHLAPLYPNNVLPDFTNKRVIVLGGGDVAVDAATSSIRLGSNNVSIVFRKSTAEMRCMIEEKHHAEAERIDFIPYSSPKCVLTDNNGNIKGMEFYKQSRNNDGEYVTDEDEFIRLKCDIIITAFGCKAVGVDKLIPGLAVKRDGCVVVDEYGLTNIPGVYAGGDLIGASTTVGSSADGKVAAWGIHCALNNLDVNAQPTLPNFHSPVDDIDLSITVDGLTYLNPFVLASAPPCTSREMIDRAFEAGWAGAVVKTFVLDKDMVTNVSTRISASTQGAEHAHNSKRSWFNIELITEKSAEYWYNAMRQLKEKYPKNIIISSVMCGYNEADWAEMVTKSIILGKCDAIEANCSCPHMDKSGMAMEIGQCPETLEEVTRWLVKAVRSTSAQTPVYIKLTPNVTDIAALALAVEKGLILEDGTRHPGGVTAINTVSGVLGFKFDASATRHGVLNDATGIVSSGPGGYCGAGIRPLAFKAVSVIKKAIPNTTILATGGIDSANVALQMIYAGAPILQVCSAVMNRDYTIVQDFIFGLKALFYIKHNNKDASKFIFQSVDPKQDRITHALHKFGHFAKADLKSKPHTNPVWKINTSTADDFTLKSSLPQLPEHFLAAPPTSLTSLTSPTSPTSPIADNVGKGSAAYVSHPELSRFDQTVALINDDNCIRCGRCYASCNDSGYQAITMDPKTRKVQVIEDKCTSCGICESVCPYSQVISFVPRPNNAILATYRGSDVQADVLKQYPLGPLDPKTLQDFKAQRETEKNTSCPANTCCGGSCGSIAQPQ